MAIHMSRIDELALITLDRPEALNALSFGQLHDLSRQLDSLADSAARALLVTGAGDRAFSAGADIKELMGRTLVEQRAGAMLGQSVLAKLDQLPMPSIALINGYAFGGGLELALACTFRLAVPTAKLGFPEIKLGLIPGYGGTQRLPRLVGEARATELILTGRTVEAAEAERIGLINRLVDSDLVEAGMAFAREVTGFSLPALGLARDAIRRALRLALARDEIAPRAAQYDRSAEFPWENVRAINALGLNAMFVPEPYGGAALSYAAYLACVREISAACAATGSIWATNFHAMKPLIDFGTEEQKKRLLPRVAEGAIGALCITEPDAGSDATHMTTRFTPDGDRIVVSGGKTFISNGDVAGLYLVFGKWSELGDGRNTISALHVEKGTPGLGVLRTEDKMGHRAV